jgi:hypothetical protein
VTRSGQRSSSCARYSTPEGKDWAERDYEVLTAADGLFQAAYFKQRWLDPWPSTPRPTRKLPQNSLRADSRLCRKTEAERPRGRECALALSRKLALRQWNPGRVSDTKAWNALVSPQVTGLRFGLSKIGQAFEFIPLISALGRIRSCAHGSGEGCCVPL